MKEKNIIFYGSSFTPLSKECYGCYHYGTICIGSVYETECKAGIVEDIRPSIVASLLLRHSGNRFVLARSFGYDLENDLKKEELISNKDLYDEYLQAAKTSQEIIDNYRKIYSLDEYAECETDRPEEFISVEKEEKTEQFDPFEGCIVIDLEDEDLPF